MIEINLLPDDKRVADVTPPARLLVIVMGVVVAVVLGFLIFNFQFLKIPAANARKGERQAELNVAKAKQTELKAYDLKIAQIKQKVETLDGLLNSNVRYGRVMERLCSAVSEVDGAWISRMTVSADSGGGGARGAAASGKRYKIDMGAYTTAENPRERDKKMTELQIAMEKWFRQEDVDRSEAGKGMNTFINAIFQQAEWGGVTVVATPKFSEKDGGKDGGAIAEALKAGPPSEGVPQYFDRANEFPIILRFEVPKKVVGAPAAAAPAK